MIKLVNNRERCIFYSLNLTTTTLPVRAGQAFAISMAQNGTELAFEGTQIQSKKGFRHGSVPIAFKLDTC